MLLPPLIVEILIQTITNMILLMAFTRSFTAMINQNPIRVNGARLALGHGVFRGFLTTLLNLNRLLMRNRLQSSGIRALEKPPFGRGLRISALAL